jgi:NTP pyrophosphatase (non-canonical NTP hydrolase)
MSLSLEQLCAVACARKDDYLRQFPAIERRADWAILKLAEEVGEAIKAYNRITGLSRPADHDREDLLRDAGDELADVMGLAAIVAERLGLDLVEAFQRKWVGQHDAETGPRVPKKQ